MSRTTEACPDCGGELLIGTVGGIAPHIEEAGYTGITEVVVHRHPLCESARLDAENIKKRVADRIAEVQAKKEARERAIASIRDEEEKKVQERIRNAMNR